MWAPGRAVSSVRTKKKSTSHRRHGKLTNSMEQGPSCYLVVPEEVCKSPAFYGTQTLSSMLTK
jgi:hypothetical protein